MDEKTLVQKISDALSTVHDKLVKVEKKVLSVLDDSKEQGKKIVQQGEQIAKLIADGDAKDKMISDTQKALSDLQAKFDTAIDATSLTSFTDALDAMGKEMDDTGLTSDDVGTTGDLKPDAPVSGLVIDPSSGDAVLHVNDPSFVPTSPAADPILPVTDPGSVVDPSAPVVGLAADPLTGVSKVVPDPSSTPAPAPQVIEADEGATQKNAIDDPSVGLTSGATTVIPE